MVEVQSNEVVLEVVLLEMALQSMAVVMTVLAATEELEQQQVVAMDNHEDISFLHQQNKYCHHKQPNFNMVIEK